MGKKFLNKKSFPYGKKINFNSLRKGEIIGEHEVKFSSGKEINLKFLFPLEDLMSC